MDSLYMLNLQDSAMSSWPELLPDNWIAHQSELNSIWQYSFRWVPGFGKH
jgi:hypothetical protein